MVEAIPPATVALGLVALWCGACALYAARSWPIAIRRKIAAMDERVREAEANLEAVQSKMAAKVVELGALTEEIEGLLESVEQKRRRIAAHAGVNKREREQEAPDDDREHALRAVKDRARAAGWPI